MKRLIVLGIVSLLAGCARAGPSAAVPSSASKAALAENQPVKGQDKAVAPKLPGLVLPEGTIGYALNVDPDMLVSGFVVPDVRIDIISTVRQDGKSISKVLLQNVLVVAVDRTLPAPVEAQRTTLTLAVTPEQATQLTVAKKLGKLDFALRAR